MAGRLPSFAPGVGVVGLDAVSEAPTLLPPAGFAAVSLTPTVDLSEPGTRVDPRPPYCHGFDPVFPEPLGVEFDTPPVGSDGLGLVGVVGLASDEGGGSVGSDGEGDGLGSGGGTDGFGSGAGVLGLVAVVSDGAGGFVASVSGGVPLPSCESAALGDTAGTFPETSLGVGVTCSPFEATGCFGDAAVVFAGARSASMGTERTESAVSPLRSPQPAATVASATAAPMAIVRPGRPLRDPANHRRLRFGTLTVIMSHQCRPSRRAGEDRCCRR
jgi:hypothetical protein